MREKINKIKIFLAEQGIAYTESLIVQEFLSSCINQTFFLLPEAVWSLLAMELLWHRVDAMYSHGYL